MALKLQGHSKLKKKRDRMLLTMCIPAMIKLFVFAYLPMIGIYLAFVDYSPRKGLSSEFIGLKNFEFFFKSGDAFRIIGTTIGTNFLFIIVGLILALSLALLMNEVKSKAFLKFVQGVSFIPYFLSWLVVGYLFSAFLDNYGIISKIISKITGIKDYSFYTNSDYWLIILTVANMWKSVGVTAVIYLANIISIDKEYYEAADLDGATGLKGFITIVFPLVYPTFVTFITVGFASIFTNQLNLFSFANASAEKKYYTFGYYLYRQTAVEGMSEYPYLSAMGLIFTFIAIPLTFGARWVLNKVGPTLE